MKFYIRYPLRTAITFVGWQIYKIVTRNKREKIAKRMAGDDYALRFEIECHMAKSHALNYRQFLALGAESDNAGI